MSESSSDHCQCVECGTHLPEGDYFCSDACFDVWQQESKEPLPPSVPLKQVDLEELPF